MVFAGLPLLLTIVVNAFVSACAGVNVYVSNAFDPGDGKCIDEFVVVELQLWFTRDVYVWDKLRRGLLRCQLRVKGKFYCNEKNN